MLSDEETTRFNADKALRDDLDAEEAARIAGDNNLQNTIDQSIDNLLAREFYGVAEETLGTVTTTTYDLNTSQEIVQDVRYFVVMNNDGTEVIGDSGSPVSVVDISNKTITFSETPNQDVVVQFAIKKTLGTLPADALITYDTVGTKLDADITEVIGAAYYDGRKNVADNFSLDVRIENEIEDRTNADNSLQSNIDSEEAARIAADNTLQDNIDAEEAARIAADNALEQTIEDEVQTAITQLQADIAAEEQARIDADNELRNTIENEVQTAITQMEEDLAAETAARQQQIADLQEQIDNDIQIAIDQMQSDLQAEKTARQNADDALQAQIDTLNTEVASKFDDLYDDFYAHHHDSQYVNQDGDEMTGDLSFSAGKGIEWYENTDGAEIKFNSDSDSAQQSNLEFRVRDNMDEGFKFIAYNDGVDVDGIELMYMNKDNFDYRGHEIWHAGNDSHNSGLNADMVDGEHKTEVKDNARKQTNELRLETRTSDPANAEVGRIWLRTDLVPE
jgi:hypothetical protein